MNVVLLRILKYILGVLLILVGLAALVTPLTPGAWLALVGVELLGLSQLLPHRIRSPWEKMKDEWKKKIHRWLKKHKHHILP